MIPLSLDKKRKRREARKEYRRQNRVTLDVIYAGMPTRPGVVHSDDKYILVLSDFNRIVSVGRHYIMSEVPPISTLEVNPRFRIVVSEIYARQKKLILPVIRIQE